MAVVVSIAAVVAISLPRIDVATVAVDADGFFAGEVRGSIEVHAGRGMQFVTRTHGGWRLCGRAEPGAETAAYWERSDDGQLAQRSIRLDRTADSHAAEALGGLRERLAGGETWGEARERFLAALDDVPTQDAPFADAPVLAAARGGPREAAPGLDLAAWVPAREGTFVRFRSVEAAYRFAAVADGLAGALLATEEEDARSYESLRLALHDLLLPSIWRTNPEAERGVGELALYVPAPRMRGRSRVAVVLRVTDPELHRMQTEAGVAEESRPDHAWSPSDDPFPGERSRRNFRRRVADVEIVATDEALCSELADRRGPSLAEDDDYKACRSRAGGTDGRPSSADEALFLYKPDVAAWLPPGTAAAEPAGPPVDGGRGMPVQSSKTIFEPPVRPIDPLRRALVVREGAGLEFLARRWAGRFAGRAPVLEERWFPASRLATATSYPRWCVVSTDKDGARMRVGFGQVVTALFASRLIQGWSDERDAATARVANACRTNLADLVPLALVENPQEDVAERNFVVLGWKPVCPCGGTYSVHPITREVSCSVHGTAKSPRTGTWKAPPVSDVKVEGNELSFRLAIDWNRKE